MAAATPQSTTSAQNGRITALGLPGLLTSLESHVATAASMALAVSERLDVAVHCDRRQEAELLLAERAVAEIVAIGHGPSANFARVAQAHFCRARGADAPRDHHTAVSLVLLRAARRALRWLGRTIEQAAVGRSRKEAPAL